MTERRFWRLPPGSLCSIADCGKPERCKGLCSMHYARLLRGNDPAVSLRGATGAQAQRWGGDDIGYVGVHLRLRRERGSAREQACVDCGGPAKHWSLNHDSLNVQRDRYGTFSVRLEDYEPRCVPCHHVFDGTTDNLLGRQARGPRLGSSLPITP